MRHFSYFSRLFPAINLLWMPSDRWPRNSPPPSSSRLLPPPPRRGRRRLLRPPRIDEWETERRRRRRKAVEEPLKTEFENGGRCASNYDNWFPSPRKTICVFLFTAEGRRMEEEAKWEPRSIDLFIWRGGGRGGCAIHASIYRRRRRRKRRKKKPTSPEGNRAKQEMHT